MLALQYFLSWGLRTIRTRAFTHCGPGRGEVFAMSSFAKQIAEIENGREPIIRVGNLDSMRTLCDVRDMVKAYWLLVTKCPPGAVYNIGGAEHMTIGKALNMLLSMTTHKVTIEIDPKRMRPSDVTMQIPDISKFVSKTDWQPEFTAERTLRDMLFWWRKKLRCES